MTWGLFRVSAVQASVLRGFVLFVFVSVRLPHYNQSPPNHLAVCLVIVGE